jgi:hypothetical protein
VHRKRAGVGLQQRVAVATQLHGDPVQFFKTFVGRCGARTLGSFVVLDAHACSPFYGCIRPDMISLAITSISCALARRFCASA